MAYHPEQTGNICDTATLAQLNGIAIAQMRSLIDSNVASRLTARPNIVNN